MRCGLLMTIMMRIHVGGGFAVETSYVGGGHVGRVLGGRATDDVSKYFTYIILLLRSELCSV